MAQVTQSTNRHGRGLTAGWVMARALTMGAAAAGLATTGFAPPASAASPPTIAVAQCDVPPGIAATTQVRIAQEKGRAVLDVTRANSSGRKLEIEYGDERYIEKFGTDGRIHATFALTAANNDFVITMSETAPIPCSVSVPDFNKFYRVTLRWHDPVQLDHNVIEPGGRMGEIGHVNSVRPNTNLTQGIGEMDVITGAPAEGGTGELSYVISDRAQIPPDSVFGFKVDYVTRGAQPDAPYCDNHPLAAPQFEFITTQNGTATTRKMSMSHAHCREKIPDARRLMSIR